MRIVMMAAGAAVMLVGTPALAQQPSNDVNSYLCTFAGKCGDQTSEAPAPTMAAPPTKGFRLASATPTIAAPPTKGFRLATGSQGAPAASVPAPPTRSFRVARAPVVAAATLSRHRVPPRAATWSRRSSGRWPPAAAPT